MQAALIIMTILGCDDSATQCHFVETRDERWATVQSCDAASEDRLSTYSDLNYPVVVAVCQTPGDTGLAELVDEPAQEPALPDPLSSGTAVASNQQVPKADIPQAGPENLFGQEMAALPEPETETEPGITTRVLNLVREALPEKASVKALVSQPVHVVTDSYSWVVQRFEK
ncbi:hypothetical protein SAMN05877838_3630 [Hoeflea halophila]|uniref:Uncharacterized protein n=1 Tax=Hoeflea halophila TaxID=714899 RepID=A0A286IH79_9HYPH|nr:hypothetical protein [Hoeflea halophila]SOE18694.1 hypothetical protein SAMN05877838_3630 [Hoeflea halophila]